MQKETEEEYIVENKQFGADYDCRELIIGSKLYRMQDGLKDYSKYPPIKKCILYKMFQGAFYECDRSKKVIEIYNKTNQMHNDHFDTMTSWCTFANKFLGFRSIATMSENYFKQDRDDDKQDRDDERKWLQDRINKVHKTCNENVIEAFICFSKWCFTIGNFVPVGYNPVPRGEKDRWDIKLKWIKDTFFDEEQKLKPEDEYRLKPGITYEKQKYCWAEFWSLLEKKPKAEKETEWKRYIEQYCLEAYIESESGEISMLISEKNGKITPQDIDGWKDFFLNVSERIQKRGAALLKNDTTS